MATVFAYEDLVARWADTSRETGEGGRRPADMWIPMRPAMGFDHASRHASSKPPTNMSASEADR
jgi:hypothetical protein